VIVFAAEPGVAVKKAVAFIVAFAVLSGPAFAQRSKEDSPLVQEQNRKKKEIEAVDEQYQSTLKQTGGGGAVRVDPWQNMRDTTNTSTGKTGK
jgi:hypothetical protein